LRHSSAASAEKACRLTADTNSLRDSSTLRFAFFNNPEEKRL
jgi:hypothetical protein